MRSILRWWISAPSPIIDREGERESFRRMQRMPFHRGGTLEGQLHRFMGSRSGRKHRYSRLLATALDADRIPAPLRELVSYISIL